MKSKKLAESNPIYIGSLNGQDQSIQIKILSDIDTWWHLSRLLIAPTPDRATSPLSAWTAPIQWHSDTWQRSTYQNHIIWHQIIFSKWCLTLTSNIELSCQYDSLMMVLYSSKWQNIRRSHLEETSYQIGVRYDMKWLPSSNMTKSRGGMHRITLDLGVGGNCWGKSIDSRLKSTNFDFDSTKADRSHK